MNLLLTVIFFLILLLLLKKVLNLIQYCVRLRKQLANFPCPPTYPILGNVPLLFRASNQEIMNLFMEWQKTYGSTYVIWFGPLPVVFTCDVGVVGDACKVGVEMKKSMMYDVARELVGNGLAMASGEDWYRRRKLLTPCFHFDILEKFLPRMWQNSKYFAEYLEQFKDKKVEFLRPLQLITLSTIADTSSGMEKNYLEDPHDSYVTAFHTITSVLIKRTFNPILIFKPIFYFSKYKKASDEASKILATFPLKALNKKKEERLQSKLNPDNDESSSFKQIAKKQVALIDKLLDLQENGFYTENKEIVGELNTFIIAGHETTSHTIGFTLFLLGHHPDIQEQVYQEIQYILPNLKSEVPSQSKLNELQLLERCIKESLRIYTVIPFIGKAFEKDINTKYGPIPKGINIMLNLWHLHNNTEIYKNPEIFNPDRFLDQQENSFQFIPFSAGPRNCIGMRFAMLKLKMLLSVIISNYKLQSLDKPSELDINFSGVLEPKNGFNIRITPR